MCAGPAVSGLHARFKRLFCSERNNIKDAIYMEYAKTVTLKDGRSCVIRNGTAADAQAVLDVFVLTHGQTEFLMLLKLDQHC